MFFAMNLSVFSLEVDFPPLKKGDEGGFNIELDGGQHYSVEGKDKDKTRDAYLSNLGIRIARFSDRDIFENSVGVVEKIWGML